MIKSLHLFNWESWKNTVINFVPGVNCIIGSSDKGKSGIMRAFDWVINNQPSGDRFISHWVKKTGSLVEIKCTGNNTIIRQKGKSVNLYKLNSKKYDAITKSTVPKDIKNALQMSDINQQYQTDPIFLLGDNPGEVARRINKTVKLEAIDYSIANVISKIKTSRNSISFFEVEKDKLEGSLLRYKEMKIILGKEQTLKNLVSEYKSTNTKIKRLSELLNEIKKEHILNKEKPSNEQVNKWISLLNDLSSHLSNLKKITVSKNELESTIEQYKSNFKEWSLILVQITKWKEEEFDLKKKLKVCPVCGSNLLKKRIV